MPNIDNFLFDNYGLGGPSEKYATGEISSYTGYTNTYSYFVSGSTANSMYFADVNMEFGFTPRIIMIRLKSSTSLYLRSLYNREFKSSSGYSYSYAYSGGGIYELNCANTANPGVVFFFVTDKGFRLPIGQSLPQFPLVWEAFG